MDKARLSAIDRLLLRADRSLRELVSAAAPAAPDRASPGEHEPEPALDPRERRHSAGLMRVNHAGEVAAQALYEGQAWTARDPGVRRALRAAAQEEADHLAWCRQRLQELGGNVSALTPLWYGGAFAIGALAGLAGDRYSMGFVAETERQVVAHLDDHLARLPTSDRRSSAVLAQMRADEARHGEEAQRRGGASLPDPIRALMRSAGRVMTGTAYWF